MFLTSLTRLIVFQIIFITRNSEIRIESNFWFVIIILSCIVIFLTARYFSVSKYFKNIMTFKNWGF